MTEKQLRDIWNRTQGHCHFCGDRVLFTRRGWKVGSLKGYWEVDHVIQRGKGGQRSSENCLPACTRCNRYRWHRSGSQLRELLVLGLIAMEQINKRSEVGQALLKLRVQRSQRNALRRLVAKETKL